MKLVNVDFSKTYRPRTVFKRFHSRRERFSIIVAHRRAGKTKAAVADLVLQALATKKPKARYGYVCPFLSQARQNAWEYLVEFASQFPGVDINKSDSKITFQKANGDYAWIKLYGADNPDALRGTYFDGVVLDEYGDMKPYCYTQIIRGGIAEREGWVLFIGTPKGKNAFYKILERAKKDTTGKWYHCVLKASETKILSLEELANIKEEIDEDEYQQEYECSFDAAIRGSYWGKEINAITAKQQIGLFPWVKAAPVHLAFDLGIGKDDSTAVWFFQAIGEEVRVIRCSEWWQIGMQDILTEIRSYGYKIGDVWLPHDAKSPSLQTGLTMIEQFRKLAQINPKPVPELGLIDGIQAARHCIQYLTFNLADTEEGIVALKAYQKEWDPLRQVFSKKPKHDWASHRADAFRYMCLVLHNYVKTLVLPDLSLHKHINKKEEAATPFVDVSQISGVTAADIAKLNLELDIELEEY